jgi:hypothetical protein
MNASLRHTFHFATLPQSSRKENDEAPPLNPELSTPCTAKSWREEKRSYMTIYRDSALGRRHRLARAAGISLNRFDEQFALAASVFQNLLDHLAQLLADGIKAFAVDGRRSIEP